MVDESEDWISAADAFKLVSRATGSYEAPRAICSRAHAGLILARAARFAVGERVEDEFDIPKEFWWACGEAALDQNWITGDFETWINQKIELKAFGVRFSRTGIEALIGPAFKTVQAPSGPQPNAGGRPSASWWDDLWIEMCRQLYAGDLKPDRQAEIEDAMITWLAANGHEAATSTIRPRARKLWFAISKEDKN